MSESLIAGPGHEHASLSERLVRAGFTTRLRLLWPGLIVLPAIALLSWSTAIEEIRQTSATRATIVSLGQTLPSTYLLEQLNDSFTQLRDAIPVSALQPRTECKAEKETSGPPICHDVPSAAAAAVADIRKNLDVLTWEAKLTQKKVRGLSAAMRSSWGSAYAADEAPWPSNEDKSFMLHAVFATLIIMTILCFCTMLWSKNTRAVTYAIDALKVFGGFYVGVVGSVFGLRR